MTGIEWDRTFVWLSGAFPQWRTSKVTSAIWYDEVGKQFSQLEFQESVRRILAINPSPFPPGVFEIKGDILRHSGRATPLPDLAWEKIMKLAARGEAALSVDLPEAAQIAVNACGGLKQIGLTEFDRLPWLKKEFVACYTQAINSGKCEPIFEISKRRAEALPPAIGAVVAQITQGKGI